ncbi:MAG TPA: MarR family transcriptional regulator [Kineosporiaceae bacterium]|nr:MarR family transcriptional regulator [Kineosporiaceae bacterium]
MLNELPWTSTRHSPHTRAARGAADRARPDSRRAQRARLADGQPRTVSELADDVGSKPTTMTSVLDRLARRELITRREHPTNRRSVVIRLTAPGAAAAEAVRIAVAEPESTLLERISSAQLAGLRAGLEQLGGRSG